jgi:hypothetical protein
LKTTISKFEGIAPKFSPNIKEGWAKTAQNVKLTDGKIKPWEIHWLIVDLITYITLGGGLGVYKWTASAHGTGEFYCELFAGGDPSLVLPDRITWGGSVLPKSEELPGSLAVGEWSYGNNDTLGYNTVYIRLTGGVDPDSIPWVPVYHNTYPTPVNFIEYFNGAWVYGADRYYCPWKIGALDILFYLDGGVLYKNVAGTVSPVGQTIPTAPTVLSLTVTKDLTDGVTYKWTASGSGTDEFYCQLAAGGDPSLADPDELRLVGVAKVKKALGSLTAGTWGYGDNDTLGYSTIYVRLSDGADPDSKDADYVQHVLTTGLQKNLLDGTYEWVLSAHGTHEYHLAKPAIDLITNGTFTTNLVGWTDLSSGFGQLLHGVGGTMNLDVYGGGGIAWAEQGIPTIPGKVYRISFSVGVTHLYLGIGSSSGEVDILDWTPYDGGDFIVYFTAINSISYINFYVWQTSTAILDNVTCKSIDDPELVEPNELRINSLTSTKGAVGALTAGKWGYGNNDALTYNTIYVRIAGGTDPDLEASWYINYILYPKLSGTYNYLYTIERTINGHVDESGPSAVSQEIVVVKEKIRITIADATYPWNLYRISLASGEYQFVAQIAAGTTTYDDNIADADLGDAPTTWYTSDIGNEIIFGPPPTGLDGLINEPNAGMLFVWDGPTLYWSEPGYPDAWPAFYSMNFPGNIKRVIAIAGVVAVLTDIGPFRVDGTSPEALQQSKVLGKEPCMSIAACATPKGVVYLSDSGIVLFNLVDTTVLTDQGFGEAWFKANVVAAGAHLIENDNILRLFHTTGTLVVDARSDPAIWYTLDTIAYASAVREDEGEVYILDQIGINLLHGGVVEGTQEYMDWSWQSGDILMGTPEEKEWTEIEVIGSGHVHATIYVDDVSKGTKSLTFTTERGRTLKVPEHTLGRALQFLLSGGTSAAEVKEVIIRSGDI